VVLGVVTVALAQPANSDDILNFCQDTLRWYSRIQEFDQTTVSSAQAVAQAAAREGSRQATTQAFAYASAVAAISTTQPEAATAAPAKSAGPATTNWAQAVVTANQRVRNFQSQLDVLNQQLLKRRGENAPADELDLLTAQRDKMDSELTLARQRLAVVQGMAEFSTNTESSSSGLLANLDRLRRTAPNLDAPSSQSGGEGSGESFRPSDAGLIGLVWRMVSLTQDMHDLDQVLALTDRLTSENNKLRDPLRATLRPLLSRAETLAQTRPNETVQLLTSERDELHALDEHFRQLLQAAVPLGEQSILLDAAKQNLQHWRDALWKSYTACLHYLLVRLGAMTAVIVLALIVAKIWRHATFKYVTDMRRRRQFLLLRRLVLTAVIVVVMIAGVVREFSSLATYAGLVTAGIAVALQSVILSGCAYFFFIGRYGVRIGDRVTINGITGDVVDIGLFRLYLMELAGEASGLHPTGRIVVFSNSVLFQASAFYKQLPGVEYAWHEVSLNLSPDSDVLLAEKRFMDAVASVYAQYQSAIQQQHDLMNANLHYQTPKPEPTSRVRLLESGVEILIRYPVELHDAIATDDKMARALLAAIAQEPKLKLVPASAPAIHPVK